jgi:hypothetical protein
MKNLLALSKTIIGLVLLSGASLAIGQTTDAPPLSGVQCQAIDSAEVANPEFAVENFDKNNQAFLICHLAQGESGADVLITGALALKKVMNKLSLEDFTEWNKDPTSTDLFVKSSLGVHQVKAFLLNTLPMDVQAIDSILGYAQSRPTIQQVCSTTNTNTPTCTIQQVQECKIVYGRQECKMVNKEVCTNSTKPVQTCHNETTISYVRHVSTIDGYLTFRPDSFCPYGMVEKQTKTVYGRVFNERRCCESKVVDGAVKNVCTDWVAF